MSKKGSQKTFSDSGEIKLRQDNEKSELQPTQRSNSDFTEAPNKQGHGDTCGCDTCSEALGDMPDEELLYDLADLFKVFADTTRIKILYSLMGRELAVNDIAEIVGATQSAVSHQLRTLKQAHLVKFHREGKTMRYSLSDDHVYTVLAQGMSHICE